MESFFFHSCTVHMYYLACCICTCVFAAVVAACSQLARHILHLICTVVSTIICFTAQIACYGMFNPSYWLAVHVFVFCFCCVLLSAVRMTVWFPVGIIKIIWTLVTQRLTGSWWGVRVNLSPRSCSRNGKWVAEWVEVLKSSGRTESPALRPRWGQQEFLGLVLMFRKGAGRVQDLSNYTIWVTGELFICAVWHVSVVWGSCAVWKTDSAEVYLFILQAKQPNRTGQGEELEMRKLERTQGERESDNLQSFSKSRAFERAAHWFPQSGGWMRGRVLHLPAWPPGPQHDTGHWPTVSRWQT